ncbi:MAG TPA: hypothetical protein PLT86_11945 [Candidatus Latescibacteria bacterium]|nr:hypothetical protein [Candidatus Latescibacterota bacterium]HPC45902.1 hypothetical protein [Candidatus Latescibacterota bacterium]HQI75358.1 hypothetical protein [Candidatus Latescibacterota bacterium]HRU24035.1 hypothetical protein [Candidatus Latescibacterota bacterium]
MNALVTINAGICGFVTSAEVSSPDNQNVEFHVSSNCEKIAKLGKSLKQYEPIDAYQEISPASDSVFMAIVRDNLKGCCSGCAVPSGLFKAMQVAAGLALPKDISISLSKR